MRRRLRQWTWYVAIAAAAFVVQLFVPPPYRIAPEDTLLYRDYILLHKQAADELAKHPQRTVLTAWPASDELTRPYLGYVKQPLNVVRHRKFLRAGEIARAAHAKDEFDIAYLFSTKWEPPHPLLESLTFGRAATGALLRLSRGFFAASRRRNSRRPSHAVRQPQQRVDRPDRNREGGRREITRELVLIAGYSLVIPTVAKRSGRTCCSSKNCYIPIGKRSSPEGGTAVRR